MTTIDELSEAIRGAMTGVLDEDAYWIGPPSSGRESDFELATDDWSLVLEAWPDGIGFFAADDEPDSEDSARLERALVKQLGAVLPALAGVNEWSGGAIAASLQRTTDPLSNALATLLAAE